MENSSNMLVAPNIIIQAAKIRTDKEAINFNVMKFSFICSDSMFVALFVLNQNRIIRTKDKRRIKEEIMLKGFVAITAQIKKVEANKINKLLTTRESCLIILPFRAIINTVKPKTKERFATFEPITFPMIMGPLLSSPAKKLVSISGAEVPNAITVDPIRKGDIPNFLAEEMEYFSSFSALIQMRATPRVIGISAVSIMLEI